MARGITQGHKLLLKLDYTINKQEINRHSANRTNPLPNISNSSSSGNDIHHKKNQK